MSCCRAVAEQKNVSAFALTGSLCILPCSVFAGCFLALFLMLPRTELSDGWIAVIAASVGSVAACCFCITCVIAVELTGKAFNAPR